MPRLEGTELKTNHGQTTETEHAATWSPPTNPGAGGHRGRYLWTDAFGVVNLITLWRETKSPVYLELAKRLAQTVHNVLGRTRDGSARLPGATDERPLDGGLRIGKLDEAGPDGDGQYHHYLTLWMFALNRLALAAREDRWNELAVQLAKAIHHRFVVEGMRGGGVSSMLRSWASLVPLPLSPYPFSPNIHFQLSH